MKPKKLFAGMIATITLAAGLMIYSPNYEQKFPSKNLEQTVITEERAETGSFGIVIDTKDEDGDRLIRSKELKERKLFLFRYEEGQFEDTNKPNAVIVYPTNDRNTAFETPESMRFFGMIREKYDIRLVIAEKEEEVYKAIDSTPDIELLILGGHGSENSLSLGEEDPMLANGTKSEEYKLDLSDKEIAQYLKKLKPQAVIFLNSCSNAKGDENSDNLANFVIKNADGRKVIASKEPFSASNVHIKSLYPFDIQIIKIRYSTLPVNEKEIDVTYTNK